MESTITAKCRQCNKDVPVNEFILDPVYKMMVCTKCSQNRRSMESKAAVESRMKKEKQEIKQEKPPGWDHEDDYLEKVHKIKEKTIVEVKQIDNERVRYKCPSCNYSFVFNIFSKKPSLCPYCNHKVRSMKIVK